MVVEQLERRGIRDRRVLDVMEELPRERFVPGLARDRAYADHPLSIGFGVTISQPYMVALMTEALGLQGSERILEIGTGSGYQAAILGRLAREVYSIERVPQLAEAARAVLAELGLTNVHVLIGDGSVGWPVYAPYDGILVTAAAPEVPRELVAQLAPGGRLVVPVGTRDLQCLRVVTRHDGTTDEPTAACVFVPLIGERGFEP
jgi:protein-L-isoaspartate(D-aspartate) O-methyltransferase